MVLWLSKYHVISSYKSDISKVYQDTWAWHGFWKSPLVISTDWQQLGWLAVRFQGLPCTFSERINHRWYNPLDLNIGDSPFRARSTTLSSIFSRIMGPEILGQQHFQGKKLCYPTKNEQISPWKLMVWKMIHFLFWNDPSSGSTFVNFWGSRFIIEMIRT